MSKLRYCLSTFLLSLCIAVLGQVPYGYAPSAPAIEDCQAIGGGKNEFVQGLVRFDPATDPALARMKGLEVLGVRVCLRAAYKQARQKRSAIMACLSKPENITQLTYCDFTEGWNSVLFDTPLPITDEPFYLGVQAYETIGTPYPLMAYAHVNVPQACIVNLAKQGWEVFPDRGTLLIEAILSDEAEAALALTAYAQNTTHPQTVAPDADFRGGLYIHNFSSQTVENVELTMQGEGAAVPTSRTLQLPSPIPPRGSIVIDTDLRAGSTEGTAVQWQATITAVNGTPAQAGRPGITPLFVTRDNFLRTPLIEEFTSQRCINCPQMAYFLEKALQQYEGSTVYVSHHSGFAEDVFTTQPDREATYLFGGYENEYNPAITYNRAMLEGESTVIQGIRDMSPTPYLEAIAAAAAMPAMAEVVIEPAESEVTVHGRVARDLVQTPLYLSCYLVEDGISAETYRQTGLEGDPDAPADLKEVFRHNGVILHHFTQQAGGDLLDVQADGTYRVTYPTAQPQGFGGTRRRYVAFVHRINKTDLRENYVLNAAQVVDGADGVQDLFTKPTTRVAPSGCYDLTGRRVQPNRVQRGIYLVNGQKRIR